MIRREDMSPQMWESMCTPMHVILPSNPKTGYGALYVGSWFASVDGDLLSNNHISNIVECIDSPWGNATQPPPGYELYKIAIADSTSADLKPHLDGAMRHIHDQLKRGKNVLVYCQQGISRSSSVVIAYMMKWHAMSYDSALKYVKDKRLCVKPNSGFEKTLREWESEIRRPPPSFHRAKTSAF